MGEYGTTNEEYEKTKQKTLLFLMMVALCAAALISAVAAWDCSINPCKLQPLPTLCAVGFVVLTVVVFAEYRREENR